VLVEDKRLQYMMVECVLILQMSILDVRIAQKIQNMRVQNQVNAINATKSVFLILMEIMTTIGIAIIIIVIVTAVAIIHHILETYVIVMTVIGREMVVDIPDE